MNVENTRGVHETLKHHLETQFAARAGVEIAIFDALGKLWDCSLSDIAGGVDAPVRTDDTIGIIGEQEAESQSTAAVEAGFEHIKIKIGNDLSADLDRVAAVRDVVSNAEIKVDANQGYSPKEAIQFADRAAAHALEIALFEQPVPEQDLRGLRQVREAVRVPVGADESVFTAEDVATVAAMEAADVINIKIQKAGIVDALDIVGIADAHGLDLMIGMMLESSIGVTAGAHLVAGTGEFSFVDLDGHFSIANPLTAVEYQPTHDIDGPGLGLDIAFEDL